MKNCSRNRFDSLRILYDVQIFNAPPFRRPRVVVVVVVVVVAGGVNADDVAA